jgi:deoxycytidine triphosphate deaminase
MLIVGSNLEHLVVQHGLVTAYDAYDVNSLSLTLDRQIIALHPPAETSELVYGQAIPQDWISYQQIGDSGLVLAAGDVILGCSREEIKMPLGYFGFIQTKGSLARLFVQVNCADGQLEAGFKGRVTFEICNLAPFSVRFFTKQRVAQLFVFRTSTKRAPEYRGRYQNATGPTVQIPEE